MAFKKRQNNASSFDGPVAMYHDYRNRKINGLLDHQSYMLNEYNKIIEKPDIALELPTGSGKTLVGLLIAEYRRRVNHEKVVYLCPTKQLAHQVGEQSKDKFGIKTSVLVGKKSEFDPEATAEYRRAGTIAVTTYSGLFNTGSFFSNTKPDVIILDDAHATENYISNFWSLDIIRKESYELFRSIVEILKQVIPESSYQRLTLNEPNQNDLTWVDKIPGTKFYEIISDLYEVINSHVSDTDLQYSWSMIKDNLFACHMYISWNSILIRPIIPPSLTFDAFSNASQRVYMSATLGESGDLERITGVPKIHRLPIPSGWNKQGLGRRLFFFPEAKLSSKDAITFSIEMTKHTNRSLMLVPDDKTARKLSERITTETSNTVYSAKDIEKTKDVFTKSDNVVAVLANRYDGIDFIDDECRFLMLMGLPRATHLQEKFLMNRMAASVLFHDRIRTRLIQAVGRCTRSAVDYAAICVLGQELIDELVPKKKLELLHPELQAEIYYGYDQSIEANNSEELLENLEIFLEHGERWDAADEDILQERNDRVQEKLPGSERLLKCAYHEVEFQYSLWRNDYDTAMIHIGQIINLLDDNELKGYRGFWLYIAGVTANLAVNNGGIKSYKSQISEYFDKAAKCTSSVTWLHNLARTDIENEDTIDKYLPLMIEGLELKLDSMGKTNDVKFEEEAAAILKNIRSNDGNEFEEGHEGLGSLLGFNSSNAHTTASPDPWWVLGDELCFSFEDKIHENTKTQIHVKDVKQAIGHPTWLKQNIPTLTEKTKFVSILLTTSLQIDSSALIFADGLYYWNRDDFVEWAIKAINVVRILRKRYNGPGDLVWRSEAIEHIMNEGINPSSLISKLLKKPITSLPTTIH